MVQHSHPYMITGKTIALTRQTFAGKVMSLPFNMLCRFVIVFLPRNAGDIRVVGSIPRSGRSPGKGHGYPLQFSCLENPIDRGIWQATVHRFTKIWTWLKRFHIIGIKNQINPQPKRAPHSILFSVFLGVLGLLTLSNRIHTPAMSFSAATVKSYFIFNKYGKVLQSKQGSISWEHNCLQARLVKLCESY